MCHIRCLCLYVVFLNSIGLHVCLGVMCGIDTHITLQRGESVIITSPGFDAASTYPINSYCSWTINCSFERRMLLTFQMMSIWPTFNCALDGVWIFDGSSPNESVLGKFCSISQPADIVSTNEYLHIIFYSGDFSQKQYHGFNLKITDIHLSVPCSNKTSIICRNGNCVVKSKKCDGSDNCGDGTDEESCGYRIKHRVTCGITPIAPQLENDDRIVGGRAAVPGSWPWQVSLRRVTKGPSRHLCGAALLNNQWALSAAHCFRGLNNVSYWMAYFGKHHKYKSEETEQVRYLDEILIHPKYLNIRSDDKYSNVKGNDVALLKLNAPVKITKYVRPICLPPAYTNLPDGSVCQVTGWGITLGTGNSDVLKQAAVPVVSNKKCKDFYSKVFTVVDSMMCAGYEIGGHDSCQGDSGGPLVFYTRGRWFLAGIVSTGGQCAAALQPGVYTRVSFFKSWILTHMHSYQKKTIFSKNHI